MARGQPGRGNKMIPVNARAWIATIQKNVHPSPGAQRNQLHVQGFASFFDAGRTWSEHSLGPIGDSTLAEMFWSGMSPGISVAASRRGATRT